MGFGFLGSMLVLTLFLRPLVCQQLNTDGFFLSDFLQKMGFVFQQSSALFCEWPGVFCDEQGQNVVKLLASGMGLSGVIPDTTIGKLIKLDSLDLSNNNITGLPSDFWSLGSLKNLNLSFNGISGSLSSNIGNFGQLESLDISSNNFSGSLPESISSLERLKVLKLNQNGFESNIPLGILNCYSLVSIDLSGNKLIGSLPDGFGSSFPKLEYLNLADNIINGRDSDFSGFTSIKYLNISGNSFVGSLIRLFQGPLQVIDVSRNQFQGHISQLNFTLSFDASRLIYMDLSENQLSGDLLTGLNDASKLKYLNLAHNRFSQQELVHLGMLSGLEYLNLSESNLIGQIPDDISLLTDLRTLDLSNNRLNGSFPSLRMDDFHVLDVSYNNLSGNIPVNVLKKLHGMDRFNFSFNNLTYCGTDFSSEIVGSAFIGSVNSCPIAANPGFFKRRNRKNEGLKLALALTISMVCLVVGLLVFAFGCRRKTRMWETKQASYNEEEAISGPFSFQADSTVWVADVKQATSVPVVIFEKPLLNFTFADLLSATSQFDRGMLLAEGRYGPVYRGYLSGGYHVAVKVLVHGSTITDQEAAKELEYLGQIKHPNLVPLTGYCLAGEQRICIYDYMENGNLQNLLHDLPLGVQATEDWNTDTWEEEDDDNNSIRTPGPEGLLTNWRFRHKIALGTARALAFLHHGCFPGIIHRDVKASSVYLDHNLEPRLSDFGLAKIFGLEDEIACGPPGYAPPELLDQQIVSPRIPTPKSDVYGFGVILFELITGKKPVDDDYHEEKDSTLVSWVRGLVRTNQSSRAIDKKIHGTGQELQMVEALKIGYLCTADHPSKRPSMQQVVGLLKDIEPST